MWRFKVPVSGQPTLILLRYHCSFPSPLTPFVSPPGDYTHLASVLFHHSHSPGRGSILGVVFGACFLDSFRRERLLTVAGRLPTVIKPLPKGGIKSGIMGVREIPPHVFRLGWRAPVFLRFSGAPPT